LIRVLELKQVAKQLGFSRIKPEGKQHIILETPMEEPAWKLLFDAIPGHLKTRFVYTPGKVTVRGLGVLKPEKQLDNLTEWFQHMRAGLPDQEGLGLGLGAIA
jgi:transcription-repair coupling factor (superfamily II helicase)